MVHLSAEIGAQLVSPGLRFSQQVQGRDRGKRTKGICRVGGPDRRAKPCRSEKTSRGKGKWNSVEWKALGSIVLKWSDWNWAGQEGSAL